jgi:hypothetical protein
MAYSVTTTDGSTSITVADQTIDAARLSLSIWGRNTVNYGETHLRNTVRHLENFANNIPPPGTQTLTGQIWYNKNDGTMRVYDGSTWKRMTNTPVSSVDITGNLVAGTAYFNSTDSSLKFFTGAQFKNAVVPGGIVTAAYAGNVTASGNAFSYGAKVETLFLTNSADDSVVPVMAIKYVSDATTGGFTGTTPDLEHGGANATILAIFSDRDFTVKSSDTYYTELANASSVGISLNKGLNLRADSTSTSATNAENAIWANYANAIYTGSFIDAANIIHTSRGYVPAISSAYNLGSATNRFGELHVDQATVYNSLRASGTVDIGTISVPFANAYVNNLFASGTISGNIGTSGAPITDLFVSNITISGTGLILTTPTTANSLVNKAYVDGQITGANITANQVRTISTATNASHFITFVDSNNGSLTAENMFTDAGISYNPSTNNLTVTGDVFADDFDTTSDATLKENVVTVADALQKVLALRGVNYNRIGKNKLELGLIAQEVEQVVPEVVGENEDGKKTVSYGNIVGLLIEAIKELSNEIDRLKSDK